MGVTGNGQVTKASPRQTAHETQPKPRGRKRAVIVVALLGIVIPLAWGMYHRSHSKTASCASVNVA